MIRVSTLQCALYRCNKSRCNFSQDLHFLHYCCSNRKGCDFPQTAYCLNQRHVKFIFTLAPPVVFFAVKILHNHQHNFADWSRLKEIYCKQSVSLIHVLSMSENACTWWFEVKGFHVSSATCGSMDVTCYHPPSAQCWRPLTGNSWPFVLHVQFRFIKRILSWYFSSADTAALCSVLTAVVFHNAVPACAIVHRQVYLWLLSPARYCFQHSSLTPCPAPHMEARLRLYAFTKGFMQDTYILSTLHQHFWTHDNGIMSSQTDTMHVQKFRQLMVQTNRHFIWVLRQDCAAWTELFQKKPADWQTDWQGRQKHGDR